ncbi:MAG: CoA-transferase subunit beta [Candidatus Dormibacterales bacterium]
MAALEFSPAELITVTASRLLKDGKVVFAGVGTPLLASVLARRTHAPSLTVVVEGGVIGAEIEAGELPISTNEMRAGRRAFMLPDITDLFLFAQRGFFDYGFLGGAQIDPYGSVNTSLIGPWERPSVRLPGSGGANDIISHCRQVFLVTVHEARRFVERLDFVTSPGRLGPGEARARAGLVFGQVTHVVTDLALMTFNPESGRMRVSALQPGVDLKRVRAMTGFELEGEGEVANLEPPGEKELRVLRELDPGARL